MLHLNNTCILIIRHISQYHYRPGQAIRLQEVESPRISRQLTHEDTKDVNLSTGRLPTHPRRYPWYSFLLETEPTPGP
jgi:hypothetical protein